MHARITNSSAIDEPKFWQKQPSAPRGARRIDALLAALEREIAQDERAAAGIR